MTGAEHVATLRRRPDRTGVLTDFDGTLAAIVEDPYGATPLPGAVDVLGALAERFRTVAVVSGRPAAFLAEHFGHIAGIHLSGLYGMEHVRAGRVEVHPRAMGYRDAVEAAAMRAEEQAPRGVVVERKGLTMTLHFRASPEDEAWVCRFAAEEAERSGLALHPARQSVELRPPVGADKGTTVEALCAELEAVCFAGDDIGDLPAFKALDRAAARGLHTVRVVAASDEVPPALLERADVVVDGPEGTLEFLRSLCA